MNKYFNFAALVVYVITLSACASSGICVDPRYHRASYESIRQLAVPMLVKVSVYFQRDGIPSPAVDGELKLHVERTLRTSRVFTPTENSNIPIELTVVANRITVPAAAQAMGFDIETTDAAAGSTTDEYYEFNFTYLSNHHRPVQSAYLHAILVPNPSGVKAATHDKAFGRVVEDVVLNFIKALEDTGQL